MEGEKKNSYKSCAAYLSKTFYKLLDTSFHVHNKKRRQDSTRNVQQNKIFSKY